MVPSRLHVSDRETLRERERERERSKNTLGGSRNIDSKFLSYFILHFCIVAPSSLSLSFSLSLSLSLSLPPLSISLFLPLSHFTGFISPGTESIICIETSSHFIASMNSPCIKTPSSGDSNYNKKRTKYEVWKHGSMKYESMEALE